jgi:hypothetical protein
MRNSSNLETSAMYRDRDHARNETGVAGIAARCEQVRTLEEVAESHYNRTVRMSSAAQTD